VEKHLLDKGLSRLPLAAVSGVKTVPGKGIEGVLRDVPVRAGSAAWLGVSQSPHVLPFLAGRSSVFCLAIDNELSAVIALQDTVRPEASEVMSTLTARNIETSLVSGDDAGPT
jgi:cation transport ATPase